MFDRLPPGSWRLDPPRPPLPGESYNGWISRVSAAEFFPTTLVLHRVAGLEWAQRTGLGPTLTDGMPLLARTLGVDVGELLLRAHRSDDGRPAFFGVPLERNLLVTGTRRFSPASLADRPHHRALWCLRPFPFCEESWEHLVDRCPDPGCAAVQRWTQAAGVANCDKCGSPLADAPTTTVDPDLRDRLRLAVGLVHPDRSRREESVAALPDELRGLSPGDRFRLLLGCARLLEPAIRSRRRTIDATVEPDRLAATMAEAWDLLAGWPASVERLAAERIARRTSRFGDGNGGGTLDFVLSDWHADAPGLAPVIDRLRATFERNATTCPNMNDVVLASGRNRRELADLRRRGFVETVFALVGDRPHSRVTVASAEAVTMLRRSGRLLQNVANDFSLPTYAVEQLCAVGLLEWFGDPLPCKVRSPVRVATASLDALRSRLDAAASQERFACLPLDRTMVGVGGRLKPWGPVLLALLDGRVPFRLADGEEAGLARRILVHHAGVETLRGTTFRREDHDYPFRPSVTRREAAELLNLTDEHAASLLRPWPSSESGQAMVPVQAVEALAERWTSTTELCATFRISGRTIAAVLRRAGVPSSEGIFARPESFRILSLPIGSDDFERLAALLDTSVKALAAKLMVREDRWMRPC